MKNGVSLIQRNQPDNAEYGDDEESNASYAHSAREFPKHLKRRLGLPVVGQQTH